jgi:hypothetical protein
MNLDESAHAFPILPNVPHTRRQAFIQAYSYWARLSRDYGSPMAERERAWEDYCRARELFLSSTNPDAPFIEA